MMMSVRSWAVLRTCKAYHDEGREGLNAGDRSTEAWNAVDDHRSGALSSSLQNSIVSIN